jgi:hypothetical protein
MGAVYMQSIVRTCTALGLRNAMISDVRRICDRDRWSHSWKNYCSDKVSSKEKKGERDSVLQVVY